MDVDPDLAELIGAAVALLGFVLIELRVREPMLPMRLFRDATFTGAQIAAFAISASFFAIFLYATLYLQQILGLSAIEAGLVYLPGTILMLIVSGATAQLGAKVPARTMIAGGLALVAAGMVCSRWPTRPPWWAVMPGLLMASAPGSSTRRSRTSRSARSRSSRAGWRRASTTPRGRPASRSASPRWAR